MNDAELVALAERRLREFEASGERAIPLDEVMQELGIDTCPQCGEPADLRACDSGRCDNCGFRISCSMG